jgi:hypothetical protein
MNLIERRDELWAQLDALLAEYKPREAVIRDEIREIQETLYNAQMRPVYDQLKDKAGNGKVSDFDLLKLSVLHTKFSDGNPVIVTNEIK